MGSELLATGSILAAFFAGGVSLFAPCCIVFLAPSYLAGAVKNRRWRILPLTFAFAAGLALVLIPITLGVSMLSGAINQYHTQLYWAGGLLMIAMAGLSVSGAMWSLPRFLRAPDTTRGDGASFFALGVFSGIASSCCAPVLAGVMTLSALSGSAVGGVTLGLAFVFGMTFPLFVMALVWDKARLGQRRLFRARVIKLRMGSRALVTNSVNLAVAVAFAIMGVWVIALADSPEMTGGGAMQTAVGEWLALMLGRLQGWLNPVPEPLLGAALVALAGLFIFFTLRDRRSRKNHSSELETSPEAPSCHDSHDSEGLLTP